MLEQIAISESEQVLHALTNDSPNPRVVQRATAALDRLAKRAR